MLSLYKVSTDSDFHRFSPDDPIVTSEKMTKDNLIIIMFSYVDAFKCHEIPLSFSHSSFLNRIVFSKITNKN